MNLFLPAPYPDELLLSVLTRRADWLGLGWTEDLADAFGRCPVAVDIPSDLSKVGPRAGPVFDPEIVLDRMTLFPFYVSFLSNARREAVRHAIVTGGHPSGRILLGLLGRGKRGFHPPARVRICPSCREADIVRFGEPYWHRRHQIGGLLFCPEHGDVILDTTYPFVARDRASLPDLLAPPAPTPRAAIAAELSVREVDLAKRVGRRCIEFLHGRHEVRDRTCMDPAEYRHRAIERGLGLNRARVDGTCLEDAFLETFGPTLLDLWRVHVPKGVVGSWLRRAFRETSAALSPLEHALVQVFLEGRTVVPAAVPSFGLGPWKCPNRFAEHSRPIERVRAIGTPERYIARATCSCGHRFTFEDFEADGVTPRVISHVRLAETFRAEIRRLVDEGIHPDMVAARLGVPKRRVGLVMSGRRNLHEWEDVDIDRMRSRWLSIMADIPDRSRTEARRRDPPLHAALKKHDHAWMARQDRRQTGDPPRVFKDWPRDDGRYAERVSETVARLRRFPEGPRMTRSFVLSQAGLSATLVKNTRLLPRTSKLLAVSIEPLEKYYLRRARQIAVALRSAGVEPTPSKMRAAMTTISSKMKRVLSDAALAQIVGEVDME